MRVGFVGLGNMGSAMVGRLLQAGHELVVYNRTRDKAAAFEGRGARVANSAREAASSAEALVTMLSDDQAVLAALLGEDGALSGLGRGCLHISSSTIGVETSRRLAELHRERGHEYVAAPVLGRPEAAEAGKLVVLAAGAHAALERAQPIFRAFGEHTHELGDVPERANVAKLAANGVLATMIQAVGEAFAVVESYGVEPSKFLEIFNGSMFKSPVIGNYGKTIAEQRFEPAGFRLPLGLKDVRLVLDAARPGALPLALMPVVRERLEQALAQGLEQQDWSAVTRLARARTS